MNILYHFVLSAPARALRLQLSEYGIAFQLQDRLPWQRDEAFLALNPAGTLPVLQMPQRVILCGLRSASEYIEDTHEGAFLLGKNAGERAEIRRLLDWFETKFEREVLRPLVGERVIKRFESGEAASSQLIRSASMNASVHLGYINFLTEQRSWLAGDHLSLADLLAAANLSVLDYFGDVDWDRYGEVKSWYMRLKSRPSFQPLLADLLPGLTPARHYTKIDF